MIRKLILPRSLITEDFSDKIGFLQKLKKYPVLLACLSSGLLYRSYVTLSQPAIYRKQQTLSVFLPHSRGQFALYSDGQSGPQNTASSPKIQRLGKLKQAIEEQIPQFFEQSFFQFPSDLVDPNTVLQVERKNGKVYQIRNQSCLSFSVTAVRLFYLSRSAYRRVELLSMLSDMDKGRLDVSFRIVLLPSPSLRDSRLSKEMLLRKLEQRAKWHEFRATFHVSDAGEVSKILITKFMPPQKPMEALKNLRQLAMLNRLSPSLPASRRVPIPAHFLNLEQTEMDSLILLSSNSTSDTEYSCDQNSVQEPTSRHPLSVLEQLINECPQSTSAIPDSCMSAPVLSNIVLSSRNSELPVLSSLMLCPSSSVSHILSAVQIPNSLTPINTLAQQHDPKFCPISSSCTGPSCSNTVASSDDAYSPDLLNTPFLPRMIRDLPHSALLRQALRSATGSFCHSL
ncbi:hypothetical protein FGIG_06235 [Fasciola gigantica]|uniref:Uncharacterized protein n=1 Tax=Fasciola gigantica TaxID=46835 RepID=A0A504Z1L2_FASGI|nr:hypothetical protein FGIG_06235 [Fasciola gigantica]